MRALSLLLAFVPLAAHAKPISARLIYDASGTRCADKAALMSEVTRHLEMNPFTNSAVYVLTVQVVTTPQGLSATVVSTKPDGTGVGKRELSSTELDCQQLFRALALEVTLAIDPLAKTEALPPPPPPPLPPEPPPPPAVPIPRLEPLGYLQGDAPSDTPVNRMTRGALRAERERLLANQPSMLPFLLPGVGLIIGGTALNVLGASIQYGGGFYLNLFGSIGTVAGIVLTIVGVARRVGLSEYFSLIGGRVDEIDAELEAHRRDGRAEAGPPVPTSPRAPH